jgi:hypothetical protein
MRVLNPSRKKIHAGDIFLLSVKEGEYIAGQVIAIDAKLGPIKNMILCRLYRRILREGENVPQDLDDSELLTPPFFTNRKPWSLGYFTFVENRQNLKKNRGLMYGFLNPATDKVHNENDEIVSKADCLEPLGIYGVKSCLTIDDMVKAALSLDRVV